MCRWFSPILSNCHPWMCTCNTCCQSHGRLPGHGKPCCSCCWCEVHTPESTVQQVPRCGTYSVILPVLLHSTALTMSTANYEVCTAVLSVAYSFCKQCYIKQCLPTALCPGRGIDNPGTAIMLLAMSSDVAYASEYLQAAFAIFPL